MIIWDVNSRALTYQITWLSHKFVAYNWSYVDVLKSHDILTHLDEYFVETLDDSLRCYFQSLHISNDRI